MRRVAKFLSITAGFIAASMLLPIVWALADHDDGLAPMAISLAAAAAASGLFALIGRGAELNRITAREALIAVTLSWIVAPAATALPFWISGTAGGVINALFEGVSGFTTTGATVIADISATPRSIVIWRSFSQWIGGIGIVVLITALFPSSAAYVQLFHAEVTGLGNDRITPRIQSTASFLLRTYAALTAIFAAILLLGAKLSFFDAATLAFTTISTGGFSPYKDSVGHFNSAFVTVTTGVFLLLAASNLTFYHVLIARRNTGSLRRNPELRLYLGIVLLFGAVISALLYRDGLAATAGDALLKGFFHTVSMVSTCGYFTEDYAIWPGAVRHLMVVMMIIGGCAISSAGGVSCARAVIILRHVGDEFRRMLHPRAVIPIRLGGDQPITISVVTGCYAYLIAHVGIFALGFTALAFLGQDMTTAISSAAATLSNVGPGFGLVGPAQSYAEQSDAAKVVYMVLMLLGRLEIFTPMLIFSPGFWRKWGGN